MRHFPLISVIVPVYKAEPYLDRCIESIAGQTYDNLEILLVDDGSPDRSGIICDSWAEKDSRIRVIHKENAGSGAARNTALEQMRGELLAFVDSDDYIEPGMYQHLYELLEMGADIAECGYVETTEDHAQLGGGNREAVCYTPEEAMRLHIRDTEFRQLIWNKLYRREVAEGIRFPEGTKIDDEYYTYQLLGNAKMLVRSDWIGYAYRQQPNSVMHEGFSIKRVQSLDAKRQRMAYLKQHMPQLESEAKEDLVMSCLFVMQGSLRSLKGEELAGARELIGETMKEAVPLSISPEHGKMRRMLLKLAQKNLGLTARMLNFLIDIHVLT